MKKFLAMLLSFVMMFSLTMPAMAAEVTGNTDNPTEGEVSGNFNPEIAFTDINVIDEEDIVYYEKDGVYIVVILPDRIGTDFPNMQLVGTNLEYLDKDNELLQVKSSAYASSSDYYSLDSIHPLEILIEENFVLGNWSGMRDGSWTEYCYSNDGGSTWSDVIRFEAKQSYTITNATTDSNGSVTAKEYAIAGETVTLNVSPAENYALESITVTDADGGSVTVENNQFTMPAKAVTVSATFKYAPKYNITVNDSENGSVSADMQTATAGTTVTLTVTPADDYSLDAVTVNSGAVEVTKVNDTTYTFVMPDEEVTVNATFAKIPHSVNIQASENGTVSTDKPTAVAGDTVTLTWTAEDGYTLDKITVTNASGEEVTVDQGVLQCTFVMPSSDVTVTATFKVQLVTSVAITWGSMEFTYDDTVAEGATEENGWTCEAGANNIVVENTGETTFTAQAAYASYEGYESITGSFDPASKELAIGEKYTFTLELSGKPTKVLSGDKIGKVTITINEAAEG